MCDCIENIEKQLPEHRVSATLNLFGGDSKALIPLIRNDTWKPETRRSKPNDIVARFCPWCGVAYAAGKEPTDER